MLAEKSRGEFFLFAARNTEFSGEKTLNFDFRLQKSFETLVYELCYEVMVG